MTNSRDKNGGISNYRDGSNLPYGQTSPVSLTARKTANSIGMNGEQAKNSGQEEISNNRRH